MDNQRLVQVFKVNRSNFTWFLPSRKSVMPVIFFAACLVAVDRLQIQKYTDDIYNTTTRTQSQLKAGTTHGLNVQTGNCIGCILWWFLSILTIKKLQDMVCNIHEHSAGLAKRESKASSGEREKVGGEAQRERHKSKIVLPLRVTTPSNHTQICLSFSVTCTRMSLFPMSITKRPSSA